MADDERRMLFDTRGRRKNVIRVVYAVLALLMGASLLLVVGPFNLGELAGGGAGDAAKVFEEEAERIEQRLVKDPDDETLLLRLTRSRISAGNSRIEVTPGGETQAVPLEAKREFRQASDAWSRYLEATDEPNPAAAQLVAGTFFRLAESETSTRAAEENVAKAAEAQRIAAAEQPNLGSLSTLAIYEYFDGNFKAGDAAKRRAAAKSPSKNEAKSTEQQLDEFRKNAKQFEQRAKQLAKAEGELGGQGGEAQNPFSLPGAGG
jgi:hypothetical protein